MHKCTHTYTCNSYKEKWRKKKMIQCFEVHALIGK